MPDPLDARLRALRKERDEADRRYNEALTALDRALKPQPPLPPAPPEYDEHQITPLNESWNILPAPPDVGGVTGKLTGLIWRTVAPYLQRQLTFNSQLVDHINRNVAAHRDSARALDATLATLREHVAHQAELFSRLLFTLQQITPYVDTKDRDSAGGALILNASLSAMAETLDKRWESMTAREQRYESRTAALASAFDHLDRELRAAIAVAQQAALTVKRELERVQIGSAESDRLRQGFGASAGASTKAEDPALQSPAPDDRSESDSRPAFASNLDAYKYVGFEDQFRGSRAVIRERLESYLPFFEGRTDVLDVGCGRGEFLDLLTERGISNRGIDLNPEMVEVCRSRALDVAHADAVGYLSSLPDAALGGVFAAQVVEHLQPSYLLQFLELAFHKLRPGGALVLETLNPACWVAFFESYIRDITHVWPLHPETLKYLVTASGFASVRIEYRSPVPERDRLQPLAPTMAPDPALADLVDTFNGNVDKLNARIFTHLDYAIVATR